MDVTAQVPSFYGRVIWSDLELVTAESPVRLPVRKGLVNENHSSVEVNTRLNKVVEVPTELAQ